MDRTRTEGRRRTRKSGERHEGAGDGFGTEARRGLAAVGDVAPDFTLPTTPDQAVSLSDFKGQRVALAFYPADWSPVCGDEMALFNEVLSEIKRHGAVVLGISVDGVWCHNAFARDRKLQFPLLSDFEPKGSVAKKYGAYRSGEGVCERALVLIDRDGRVAWSYLSPIGVNPGADGLLAALEELDRKPASPETRKEAAA